MSDLSKSALLVSELVSAITSVSGPWLDLSDPDKIMVTDVPGYANEDIPREHMPLVVLYSGADTTSEAATTRHQVSTPVSISLIHRPEIIDRLVDIPNIRTVGRQIIRALFDRQRTKTALLPLYMLGDAQITADCPENTISCSVKFTLNHLEAM